ncbi:MAG: cupin domain-containing protein [Bryobacteraceae bacterium]|nr:cupin domain-containing protein [Bryobacteraceae bacterium]
MIIQQMAGRAVFQAGKMGKASLAAGEYLYAGLNGFEPGQAHEAHVHENQDKMYVVLEGSGVARVGEEEQVVAAGDLILAPAGVVHGMRNPGPGRLVVLVVFGPPPVKS